MAIEERKGPLAIIDDFDELLAVLEKGPACLKTMSGEEYSLNGEALRVRFDQLLTTIESLQQQLRDLAP